jgi:hypothetical protein
MTSCIAPGWASIGRDRVKRFCPSNLAAVAAPATLDPRKQTSANTGALRIRPPSCSASPARNRIRCSKTLFWRWRKMSYSPVLRSGIWTDALPSDSVQDPSSSARIRPAVSLPFSPTSPIGPTQPGQPASHGQPRNSAAAPSSSDCVILNSGALCPMPPG